MAYTFIFMRNSQTNKPPVTISIAKWVFWSLVMTVCLFVVSITYYTYVVKLPAKINENYNYIKDKNLALLQANKSLTIKNSSLVIENTNISKILDTEQNQIAELQAQANIVEKIRKDSLDEIAMINNKLKEQNSQIVFYEELMSPAIKQELQCFNINATYGKKYVDYGLNLVLDNKSDIGKKFRVELRLLTGIDNIDLTKTLPEELAPDTIRDISIKNSMRLTGKIKHLNKLSAIKVIDIRVFNKSNKMISQCWKVF